MQLSSNGVIAIVVHRARELHFQGHNISEDI